MTVNASINAPASDLRTGSQTFSHPFLASLTTLPKAPALVYEVLPLRFGACVVCLRHSKL